MGTTTIIRREQRAVTVSIEDPEERDFGDDRPTSAINPLQLRGLIEQAGGLDAEIEVIAKPEIAVVPPTVIVEAVRPTCAIDPEALRALVRPPVYPVYRGASARWILFAAAGFAMLAMMLLILR